MKNLAHIVLLIILNLFQYFTFAQTTTIDSLRRELRMAKHDTTKAVIYLRLGEQFHSQNPDSALILWQTAVSICEGNLKKVSMGSPVSYVFGTYYADGLNNIGLIYYSRGNNLKTLEYFGKSLKIREEMKYKEGVAQSLNNIGVIYNYQGNIPLALEYFIRSLRIRNEIGDKTAIAVSLNNIGKIYEAQSDYHNALEYYIKNLVIWEALGYKTGISASFINIGSVYNKMGDKQKAKEYFEKSLKIDEELGNKKDIAEALNSIGGIYLSIDSLSKALKYYTRSLKLNEEIGEKRGTTSTLLKMGLIFLKQKNWGKALDFTKKSFFLSKELGFPEIISMTSFQLKNIYQSIGEHKLAFQNYEIHILMRDSISNETNRKASMKKQFQIEYEGKAIRDSIMNLAQMNETKLKNEQAITSQKTYTYGGFAGLALMLVVAGVSIKAYRNKQRANVIITEQKQFVEAQKHIIEEKQKEIIDSINYARRIQRAHLPNEKYISRKLSELRKES